MALDLNLLKTTPRYDERPAKGRWARGGYQIPCGECHRLYYGDKRSLICADCAYAAPIQTKPPTAFEAFEWLRAEALKNNPHAGVLRDELVRLNALRDALTTFLDGQRPLLGQTRPTLCTNAPDDGSGASLPMTSDHGDSMQRTSPSLGSIGNKRRESGYRANSATVRLAEPMSVEKTSNTTA